MDKETKESQESQKSKKAKDYNYEDFLNLVNSGRYDYDIDKIKKAYHFAQQAHAQQKRKSGQPYISHPISVAYLLVKLGMDTECVITSLLHDVVEDTDVTLKDIEKNFGKEVATLTDGVTKLGKIQFDSKEERQAENIRKMLIAMSHDIRVIIIKLADRLHNLRTIEYLKEQKQRDKALETLEIYAPIADRLGIRAIKEEMEDLSLKCLDPVAYQEIVDELSVRAKEKEEFINKVKKQLEERLAGKISHMKIDGRVKSIFGIYHKVYELGRSLEEIYDIYAVRVIVDTVNDCYNILGVVHDMYTPIPNRFKDYISTPKQNLYQSLHTTVLSREAIPFEVQIRTWEMHHTAEYGIAAHWKYKMGISEVDAFEERISWIRQIIENQSSTSNAIDLIRDIKNDLIPEEVFVFTPKGDIIRLPSGATVIDFAYKIHTSIGNRMVSAKIDGRIVPINQKVKTGQIIEILTSNDKTKGPSRDWIGIVKTNYAKNRIRGWFKKEKKEENIITGKAEIDKELKRNNITLSNSDTEKFLRYIAKKRNLKGVEELYASIGYGGIVVKDIMPKIKEEYAKFNQEEGRDTNLTISHNKIHNNRLSCAVIVEGLDDCLIRFAKCCNPLPGDDIIGFVTRGYGVSIHKKDCINVPKDLLNCPDANRWVSVSWDNRIHEQFESSLEITVVNREGLLADLTSQLRNMHVFINSLHSKDSKDYKNSQALVNITITVESVAHLNYIIKNLGQIRGILSIRRI